MTKYIWNTRITAAVLVLAAVLSSCRKSDFEKVSLADWNPAIAVPIANSTMTIYDFVKLADTTRNSLSADPNTRLVSLVYHGDMVSLEAPKVITLGDQNAGYNLNLTQTDIDNFQQNGRFDKDADYLYPVQTTNGAIIDSFLLDSGSLDFNITSDFKNDANLEIKLPMFTKNGVPMDIILPLQYKGTTPVIATAHVDLAGYHCGLDYSTIRGVIDFHYIFSIINSGNPITTSDQAQVNFNLQGLKFSRIFGDFGKQDLKIIGDNIDIKVFRKSTTGVFKLNRATLKMTLFNSFGFPIEAKINSIVSVNTTTGQTTPVNINSNFKNPFRINFPSLSNIGGAATTSLVLDNTNSDITKLIEPTPKYLKLDVSAFSNPDGPAVTENFMTKSSRFTIRNDLEMPFDGLAYDFQLADTAILKVGNSSTSSSGSSSSSFSSDKIESVLLRLNIDNGFPIDMNTQIYLTDSNFKIIDSLIPPGEKLLLAASIDSKGDVTSPTKKITDVIIDHDHVAELDKAKYLLIKAVAESFDARQGTTVRIYDYYKMDVRVGAIIKTRKLNK